MGLISYATHTILDILTLINYRHADFEADEKPKGDPWKSNFFVGG